LKSEGGAKKILDTLKCIMYKLYKI
jgi:hypothetical protein